MKLSHNYFKILGLVFTTIIFITLSAMIFNHKDINHKQITYDCSADYNATQSSLNITSSVYLIIGQKNYASFDITGSLQYKEQFYKVSRKYTFNYRRIGDKNFQLTNISLSKRAADDASDIQMEHLIFNYSSNSEKIMQVTKIMNAYVIGNAYSPLFICISN